MLVAMIPLRRVLGVVFVAALMAASCAAPNAFAPVGAGGGGGAGGGSLTIGASTTSSSTSGSGGIPMDDGGPPPVDAGACAPFAETFMPSCLSCLATSCCDVALACFGQHDCFGYTTCQQNCPPNVLDAGNVCLSACSTNFPMAEPAFDAMTACLHASCASVCPY